jgi:secretion/DNA translocation related TadE-like protein
VNLVGERGSGALLVITATAVVALLGSVLLVIAVAAVMRAQVQQAADLTALGAAPLSAEPGCDVAERIASANEVRLLSCTWSAGRAEITVAREFPLPVPGEHLVRAHARAEVVMP